ncbi:MAG: threonine-phosphate decarboxylase CobD [Thiohalomonadaceae bacterium]
MTLSMALPHGGRLRQAARDYGIPLAQWLDLSTGINPAGWPVPPLPAACWQRLPEDDDGLLEAAAAYYGTTHLLPCAGSQQAIQALPLLRAPGRVGLLQPSYAEHAHAWRRAGHEVVALAADDIEARLAMLDVLLLVHPNNPGGERFASAQLLSWQERLAVRGGWLVVDEAFMDATPQHSIATAAGREGLVVLRSLGKFFGLAGARVGFVLAWPPLLQRLMAVFGPWPVNHPAREVARLALLDTAWQEAMRGQLLQQGARLHALLTAVGLPPHGGTALFQYLRHPAARHIHQTLAQQGILVRHFDQPAALRFGLPGSEAEWQRLHSALSTVGAGDE